MSWSSVDYQWCLGQYIPFYSFGLIWPKMVQYISTKTSLTVHTVLCTASIYQTTRSHSSTYKPYVSDTLQYSWIHHIIGPDFPGFPLFLFFIITQFKCIQNLCRIMFESIFCHTIMLIPFFLTTFRSERLFSFDKKSRS